MKEQVLPGLASILFFGISAQWLAWRFKFPVIIFLLVFGFLIGPVTKVLDPNAIFGEMLFPVVSILVAVILFEGGLSLKFSELRETGKSLWNLLTIGVLVTWLLICVAAHLVLGLKLEYAMLLGAILVVTGPTVVGPLLKHVRPTDRTANILKWEGIIIDPVGVLFTLLVYDILFIEGLQKTWIVILFGVFKTVLAAVVIGCLLAWALVTIIKRYWAPDHLHAVIALMMVVAGFAVSDYFQPESGLFTVTIMGIFLANQKEVSIRHIEELKENLRILFISTLFIVLGARLKLESLSYVNWQSLLFLAALIFIVRPISVFASMLGSNLTWRERAFIAWMAPRGIVAAAVASIFSFQLAGLGHSRAEFLEAYIFIVIIGTVLFYGLTAGWAARALGVAKPDPRGVLMVGAHDWARAIAKSLSQSGVEVILTDTNYRNVRKAREEGLNAHYGDILSEGFRNDLNLDGVNYLFAVTPNNEANSLIAVSFMKDYGRERVYQIAVAGTDPQDKKLAPIHFRGRPLFADILTYDYLTKKIAAGGQVKNIHMAGDFDSKLFFGESDPPIHPLFLINEKKEVHVFTDDFMPQGKAENMLIVLVEAG